MARVWTTRSTAEARWYLGIRVLVRRLNMAHLKGNMPASLAGTSPLVGMEPGTWVSISPVVLFCFCSSICVVISVPSFSLFLREDLVI